MVVHWINIGMGMGSNLGRTKVNFLFAKIYFCMNVKGQGNPSNQEGLENSP